MFLHQTALSAASRRFSGRTSFGGSQGRFAGCAGKFRPTFQLDLVDTGAGIVSLSAGFGVGATPTFTRASTAYTLLSNGLYSLIATGQPRSIYSAAGTYLGYQAEGARSDVLGTTNAIRRDMSDAGWVVSNMTKGTTTGIDGTAAAAATMTATAGNATVLFTTVLGATVRTFGAWVSRITGSGTVNITGDNGTTWTPIVPTAIPTLFQFTTASAANPVVGFRCVTSGDAIKIDFNTLEQASFSNPTPIPVNVSKAADALSFPTSGNELGATGTSYGEFTLGIVLAANNISLINNNGAGATMFISADPKLGIIDSVGAKLGAAFVASANTQKLATTWGGTASATAQNGIVTAAGFSGDLGIGTTFSIGASFGAVKNIKLYKNTFSTSALSAMTT